MKRFAMWNIAKTRITRPLESAYALPEEVTTMPGPFAVAVPYTGLSGHRKDSFTEQLISMHSISFVIARGCPHEGNMPASADFMHSLRLPYALFIAIGMESEDTVKDGGGSAMSTLILGLLTLSAIPFLLFCLWGFHSPIPRPLHIRPGEATNQANVDPTAITEQNSRQFFHSGYACHSSF